MSIDFHEILDSARKLIDPVDYFESAGIGYLKFCHRLLSSSRQSGMTRWYACYLLCSTITSVTGSLFCWFMSIA